MTPSGSAARQVGRWIGLVAGAVVLFALGCAVLLAAFERRLIYFPERHLHTTPDRVGLVYEDVELRAADGVRLHAWFLPSPTPGVRRAVLVLHGNAGNISDRLALAGDLLRLGAHVLLLDWRGYGRSEGEPDEEGLYLDGSAAFAALQARSEVAPEQVVVFGQSLGGGVATEVALRNGAVAGVVLESTFTSVPDLASVVYPLPGIRWLVRTRYDNLAKVGRLRMPVLVVHGDRDEVIPIEMGRQLADAAGTALVVVPGAHHNDVQDAGGQVWQRAMRAFLDRVAPPPEVGTE